MRYGRVLLALAFVLAGCAAGPGPSGAGPGTAAPGTTAPGTTTPGAATSPGSTPFARPDLTPLGLGPYAVGTSLDALRAKGLVANIDQTPACPGIVTAQGAAPYGSPGLVFFRGTLESLRVTDPRVRTAEGVTVGQTGAKVRDTYAAASDLNNGQGGRALIVQVGAHALLFRVDIRDVVTSIDAGLADPLQFRFTDGEGC